MATGGSSETLVNFCHVRQLHIPDDSVFHNSPPLCISSHKFTCKIIDLDENNWIWPRVLWNLSCFRWIELWICNLLKAWTEHFVSVWCCSNLLYCHYVVGQLIATCIYFFLYWKVISDKWNEEAKWSEVKWSEAKRRKLKFFEDQLNAAKGRE